MRLNRFFEVSCAMLSSHVIAVLGRRQRWAWKRIGITLCQHDSLVNDFAFALIRRNIYSGRITKLHRRYQSPALRLHLHSQVPTLPECENPTSCKAPRAIKPVSSKLPRFQVSTAAAVRPEHPLAEIAARPILTNDSPEAQPPGISTLSTTLPFAPQGPR